MQHYCIILLDNHVPLTVTAAAEQTDGAIGLPLNMLVDLLLPTTLSLLNDGFLKVLLHTFLTSSLKVHFFSF